MQTRLFASCRHRLRSGRGGLRAPLVLAFVASVASPACRTGGSGVVAGPPAGATMQRLTVTSQSFASNAAIPVDYTCDGADRSPQLTWSAAPEGTKTFAIVAVDPDASGGEFVHWVAFNVRGDVTSLAENADLPSLGGVLGINGFNRPGYSGPCPPKMEVHGYAFHVFALDAALPAQSNVTADTLSVLMNGHVLAEGTLVGTFSH